jgi:hypothetical protein
MSAIEVLKEWNNKPIIFDESFMTKEDYIEQVNLKVAIKEALLALEQKEKLSKWLDNKEAKLKDIKEKGWSLEQLAGKQILINEIRKEVLERVGEEK